ncbi:PAS domain S-box protein [Niveibacterium sp. 24ML]|uniref:sensor histidine kinase n=1 Tax=Niveibacterium sp. 24ML TaxID=2985512 RepID=UPI00226EE9CF|nr:PAS domain S-box protein [Niveibacterium sp. 24ML]MCX9157847.1 PAS domain S-box protein [Niveibacterium sp. 24ML]
MIDRRQNGFGGRDASGGAKRSLWPAAWLALAVALLGSALSVWVWRSGLDGERQAFEQGFHATAQEVITRMDTDVSSALTLGRAMASTVRLLPALTPQAWQTLLRDVQIDQLEPPRVAVLLVSLANPEAADMQVVSAYRLDTQRSTDAALDPWMLRLAQTVAGRALRDRDAAVASGGDGRPGGKSLLALATPVSDQSVLLQLIDARAWLATRGAILSQDAALRAMEVPGSGPAVSIVSSLNYPEDPEFTEVGVFAQGDQRWAFEVASLAPPPGLVQRVHLLLSGLLLSSLLAVGVFTQAARKRLADRLAYRVRRDLALSEARFERALAASHDGIWEYRPGERTCLLSANACEFLGLTPQSAGFPLARLMRCVARADRHELFARLRVAVRAREPFDLECRVRAGDGAQRWVRIRGDLGALRASGPQTVIGAISDVSLYRRLTERLAQEQAALARVLDVVPVPISVKGRAGTILLVNAAFEQTFGLTRDRLVGMKAADLDLGAVAQMLAQADAALKDVGDATELRAWLDLPAGRRHFRMARCLCAGGDGAELVVGAYIDISDETAAEARQTAFRKYLQGLINAMPHAFFVKDAASRFVLVNPAFCSLYELKPEEVLGKTSFDVFGDAAIARVQVEHDQRVLAGGSIEGEELRYTTRAGTHRVIRVHKALCADQDGAQLIAGVATDITDLVAAQDGQREVIERLDSLYRNAPFGLALIESDGRILLANPSFRRMFALDDDFLRTRRIGALSPPALREAHQARFASLLASGRLAPFETRYRDAKGNELAVRVAGAAVGHNGQGYGLAWGIVEDISDRVAAAAALQESERRWQFALDGAGDGVWDWDLVSGRVFFSRQWKAMLGYDEAEVGGRIEDFASRAHPDDLEPSMALVQQHLDGLTPMYQCELRMRCKDGSWKWVLDRGKVVERDERGKPLRVIGTHTDISARKQAEADLRRSATLLGAISDVQEAFIRESDAARAFDGLLQQVLAISDSSFGFIGEVLYDGEQPYLKTNAISNIAWDAQTRAFYAEHAPRGMEFRNLNTLFGAALLTRQVVIANDPASDPRAGGLPAGHPPLTAFLGMPVMYGEQLVGMVGVANRPGGYTDALCEDFQPLLRTFGEIISARRTAAARRAAEAELAQHRDKLADLVREQTIDLIAAKEAAEAANEAKGMFLANMSHELRTPLHAVLSFSRLGEGKVGRAQDERLREYFQRITTSGERLLNLLNDLLDLAKLEAGHMQIEPRPVELSALIREVLSEYDAWFAAKRLEVGLTTECAELRAWADALRFGQVVRNLLSNAVKFTPEGRRIELALSHANLHGTGGVERAAIELAVSDQGVGIPEDELETVFDKFVQSSKTHTGAGGTGLGLAICREIVAAHGGVIFARNNPEGGARFTVRLPAVEDLQKE